MTRTHQEIEANRTGDACIELRDVAGRPRAGIPIWVEQESHAFEFGCVAPELAALSDYDRKRCHDRLREVFNRIVPAGHITDSSLTRFEVPAAIHMNRLRSQIDQLSPADQPVEVWVRGRCIGLDAEADERASAERVAALYSLCFAHPTVRAIIWDRFWDGEPGAIGAGLLRLDFSPKPAFRYLQKLIGTVWHSRASGAIDSDGRFRFRGFFGDYRVGIHDGPITSTAQFSHRQGAGTSLFTFPTLG